MESSNPYEIADIIENLVKTSTDRLANRTFKRGVVASVDGRKANVYIEGNAVATQNVMCLGSYNPYVGDKVLLLSIGTTGTNLVIIGGLSEPNGGLIKFCATKTSNQGTGTSSALHLITFDSVDEMNNTSFFSTGSSSFTAPADGWFEGAIILSLVGGTTGDDTMSWGVCLNGSWKTRATDNWNYHTTSGVDYVTNISGAFNVKKDDIVDVRWSGNTHSMTLLGGVCTFTGTFTAGTKL